MFYDQLIKLCKQNNISVTNLVVSFGMSKGNIGNWKKGGTPNIDILEYLCKKFNVTSDYLLGFSDDPSPPNCTLTTVQFEILQQLERLTPEQLDAVKALISGFSLRKD